MARPRSTWRTTAMLATMTASLALGACGSGASSANSDTPSLRIGVNVALSGTGAFYGVPMLNAWKVIAAERNKDGGLQVGDKRYKIDLIVADNKWDPKLIRQIANKQILDDKVQVTVTTGDPQDPFIVPVSEPNKTILLDWTSNNDLAKAPNKYVINGLPTALTIAGPFFDELLTRHPEIKSVYGIAVDIQYDHNNIGWTEAGAKAKGLNWLGTTFYPDGTIDYTSTLAKAVRANPDMIALGSEAGQTPAILQTLRDLGYKGIVGSATASENLQEHIKGAGKAAEGYYQTELFSWPLTPQMDEFKQAYTAEAGGWNPLAVAHWLSAQFLLDSIVSAGTVDDADAIVAAAEKQTMTDNAVPGSPTIKLGGAQLIGQNRILALPVALNQAVKGEPTTATVLTVPVP